MTFLQAIASAFRQYVGFGGRARRSEFWWFVLFYVLVSFVVGAIDGVARSSALGALEALAFFLPTLAIEVRRLHDIDKSGWWILLGFIPLIGLIILIVWWCRDGVAGDNRFGPDPKRAGVDPTVFDASPPARPV
ncbi:MAG: DUF805 domain-containing protein [Caulobacteraceae bacterium]|nr:DUF805 domain-containing protein [Caulobacter sp.]